MVWSYSLVNLFRCNFCTAGAPLSGVEDWFGADAAPVVENAELGAPLRHVATREWHMACNWKIFCDNVLVRGRLATAVRFW